MGLYYNKLNEVHRFVSRSVSAATQRYCQILRFRLPEQVATGTKKISVCGGLRRQKLVYTSDTNAVQVSILSGEAESQQTYFLFKYEGEVHQRGAVDVERIGYAWCDEVGRLVRPVACLCQTPGFILMKIKPFPQMAPAPGMTCH